MRRSRVRISVGPFYFTFMSSFNDFFYLRLLLISYHWSNSGVFLSPSGLLPVTDIRSPILINKWHRQTLFPLAVQNEQLLILHFYNFHIEPFDQELFVSNKDECIHSHFIGCIILPISFRFAELMSSNMHFLYSNNLSNFDMQTAWSSSVHFTTSWPGNKYFPTISRLLIQSTEFVLDIDPVVNSCKLQQQHWRGIRASIYLRYKQENTSRNWNRFLHKLSMDGPTFFDVPLNSLYEVCGKKFSYLHYREHWNSFWW